MDPQNANLYYLSIGREKRPDKHGDCGNKKALAAAEAVRETPAREAAQSSASQSAAYYLDSQWVRHVIVSIYIIN